MITLENAGGLPQARALLVIQSETDVPSVSLSVETVREEVRGEWVDSTLNGRQVVGCFIEQKPFKLSGKVARAYAVECPSAFKVVVEVEAKMALSSTYEKGDKSKEFCQVSLVRVVEVWSTPSKRLWAAQEAASGASVKPAATLDAAGRIVKEVARS